MITVIKSSSGGGAQTADSVSYSPTGDLTATDVQAAIDELVEKIEIIDGGTAADPVT